MRMSKLPKKHYKCIICGEEFETTARHAKFCKTCKMKMVSKHYFEEDIPYINFDTWEIEKVCKKCGEKFMAKTGNAKYCPSCWARNGSKKIKVKENKPSYLDIAKQAREHNMSYGKYIAYTSGMIPKPAEYI